MRHSFGVGVVDCLVRGILRIPSKTVLENGKRVQKNFQIDGMPEVIK